MQKTQFDKLPYELRYQLSLIAVLFAWILLFKTGVLIKNNSDEDVRFQVTEPVKFDLIDITVQESSPPSPGRPSVPIVLTTDKIVDDLEIDLVFDIEMNLDTNPILQRTGQSDGDVESVIRPDRPPRVVRIVEPIVPPSVVNENIRAELIVEFTVDDRGQVTDIIITEIKALNRATGRMENSSLAGKGIIEATIQAAQQWQFRPAQHEGNAVKAVSRHVFTFGRE